MTLSTRSDRTRGAATVADVAYDNGFAHVARFAAAYKAAYGEAPILCQVSPCILHQMQHVA
ncbi:helix-turn-helix domain-containing protein [Gordonia sp. BP-94]|nr:helix-turn-helix domain-containing protein [Gordonia sp. BP-119]MBN0985452.1 helix-turn-helix domain-containing protein [Gordonia sp. BP-94]PZU00533.1 MAG: hypothetical protein DI630_14215 [Gordonia sp. (in: high G+C Gram-positive bacteria)]QIK50027.1 helix-turn-helix domain-containing protein [Gordonia terrae]